MRESEAVERGASTRCFEIEGRRLAYPVVFQDGCSAVGLFTVPAAGAQELIRESGFEVAELWPGRAAFSLACCHYLESECGAYNEIAMSFFVKPAHGRPGRTPYLGTWLDIARGASATYIWKLPVTTRLANDAGVQMWGFPKTVEEIDFDRTGGRASFQLRMDGREVLRYSVSASGRRRQPPGASAVYSTYEGAAHVTCLESEFHEVGVRFRGGRLGLGDHPIAEQLRGLGLPRRPLVATWMGKLFFSAGAPQKL